MKLSSCKVIVASLLVAALSACSSGDKAETKGFSAEESVDFKLTATVTAINMATREVTLADAKGESVTILVGPQVQRLNEVKVGDDVNVDYRVSLLGELRPPTADEAANPITLVDTTGKANASSSPAAGTKRVVRVVTTVQAVDLPNMLVTLKGPMGDMVTIHAKKPENVKKLRVGDTVVITYTEALAVSLERLTKK